MLDSIRWCSQQTHKSIKIGEYLGKDIIMALPRFILLKSNVNNKYLRYSKQETRSNHGAVLLFSHEVKDQKAELEKADGSTNSYKADESPTPEKTSTTEIQYLKFEVEKAKTVEGLVHIRTCYNNKYWVRKSADSNWIVAEGNEPEEDQSKWDCTLFKPVLLDVEGNGTDDDQKKLQLLHVAQFNQRYVSTSSEPMENHGEFHLVVGHPATSSSESDHLASKKSDLARVVFTVKDADDAAPILPFYATFMGPNDKYLAYHTPSSQHPGNLSFTATDFAETGVAQMIFPSDISPQIFIEDRSTRLPWLPFTPPYINASPLGLFPQAKKNFVPIKVGNYIALQHIDDNKYAYCNSDLGNALCGDASTIIEDALLRVGEPVRVREITDATYDLKNSRIYNTSSIDKYSDTRSNYTDVEQTGTFEVEYKVSQTMTWNQSITVNIGVSVNWSAGIPYVGNLGVDVSYEHSQTWEWGGTNTAEKTIQYTQDITIPPMKKVTLNVVAMKASCDVPFTCKVHDLMTFGDEIDYNKNDGLYVGINEFQFDTVITEDDL